MCDDLSGSRTVWAESKSKFCQNVCDVAPGLPSHIDPQHMAETVLQRHDSRCSLTIIWFYVPLQYSRKLSWHTVSIYFHSGLEEFDHPMFSLTEYNVSMKQYYVPSPDKVYVYLRVWLCLNQVSHLTFWASPVPGVNTLSEYSDVVLHLRLRRTPSFTLFTIMFPSLVFSVVSAASFLLPPDSEGKRDPSSYSG